MALMLEVNGERETVTAGPDTAMLYLPRALPSLAK